MPRLFPVHETLPVNLTMNLIVQHMKQVSPPEAHSLLTLLASHIEKGEDRKSSNVSFTPKQLATRLDRLVSEMLFLCPDWKLTNGFTKRPAGRVFYYRFMARSSPRRQFATWADGALHYEEVQFVFGRPLVQPNLYLESEQKLSRRLMRYWTNFAKYGYVCRYRSESRSS
jgi:carboxylesterase type B